MSSSWEQGRLFAVERDLAKRLFSARDPQALADATRNAWEEADSVGRVECRGLAEQLQTHLDAVCETAGQADALGGCLTGLRALHREPGWEVSVIRPDLVDRYAEVLASTSIDSTDEPLQALLQATLALYQHAAEHRAAVAYAVQRDAGSA